MKNNILTKFEYEGKIYYTTDDSSENLYNEDGTIFGKVYEKESAKIIKDGKIII